MSKKNIAAGLLCTAIVASSAFAIAGCGNIDLVDSNNKMGRIQLKNNDRDVLRKIDSWKESENESVTFINKDTAANVNERKPAALADEYDYPELG